MEKPFERFVAGTIGIIIVGADVVVVVVLLTIYVCLLVYIVYLLPYDVNTTVNKY